MALDLKAMRAIQGSLGSPSLTETLRREAVHNVSGDFHKSLSVDKFLLFNKKLTDIEYDLCTYDRKYSHYNGVEQKFITLLDADVEAGDLVYCVKQDEYWITITSSPINYIYRRGLQFLCDTTIKWEDKDGNVWEYPVSDNNATQYNSGIFQGRYVDYVTNQHKLITCADENICGLRIDTRFFLGKGTAVPEVYQLTQIDTTSLAYGRGIATLTLLRTTYNPETDDVNTGLCRFVERVDNEPPAPTGDIKVTYIGEPTVIIGTSKKVSANVPACAWAILESDIAALVNITPTTGNEAIIEIPITDEILDYLNKPFTLICNDLGTGNTSTQSFLIIGGA